jgi:4-aminobutyrate aminotransferase-like enzyme
MPVSKTTELIRKQAEFGISTLPEGREPAVFVEGKGMVVRDLDGREYIDCFGGYSAVNLGHCHPKVVKAIQDQAAKLWHVSWDYYNVPQTELAEKLAEICPKGLKRSLFSNCGAEAVEFAVKLAKKYHSSKGKLGTHIISLMGSFHGRTSMAIALTGQSRLKAGLGNYVASGVVHAPAPYCYRCFFGLAYPECDLYCAKSVADIIKYQTHGEVAAFISEPVMGEGGIIVPPDDYLREVLKVTKEYGALYIADEIQSGFGRTGKLFALEWYGVTPDILVLAKGIASGVPIAATVATDEVANAFTAADHSSTYGGNAIMCAAALANIEVMLEERIPENALKVGTFMLERLQDLVRKFDLIGDVRGRGLMIGVELVKDRKSKEPAVEETVKVRDEMRKRGVLIGKGGTSRSVLRIQPPLIITEEQAHTVIDALDASLQSAGRS